MKRATYPFVIAVLLFLFQSNVSFSFGLLAHEAIIDATWDNAIVPLLKEKYPDVTAAQLKEAHAYVNGGSILPDIGYYPLGSVFFTHLVHYVRTGDFVEALLKEATNINEYAFALGMLCHYTADTYGHPQGTNRAVPLLFPKLKNKYGDVVTYEEDPVAHVQVEFGFDVLETAKGHYRSEDYHNLVGFKISEPVLQRAFLKTYGMDLKTVFPSMPVAEETFRFTVKAIFPRLAKDAWKARHNQITKLNPLATKKDYSFHMTKKEYKKEFGKPRLLSPITFALMAAVPKIGPLARFKFKAPSEEAEKLFDQSVKAIIARYSESVKKLSKESLSLADEDLDTGKKTAPGEYKIADKTYYKLITKLKKQQFAHLSNGVKKDIITFYSRPDAEKTYSQCPGKWKKVTVALEEMKAIPLVRR